MPSIAIDNLLVRLGFLKQKNDPTINKNSDRLLGIFRSRSWQIVTYVLQFKYIEGGKLCVIIQIY